MTVETFLHRVAARGDADALVDDDGATTYGALASQVLSLSADWPVQCGDVVLLASGFSRAGAAAMLALMARGCITVPLVPDARVEEGRVLGASRASWRVGVSGDGHVDVRRVDGDGVHALYEQLRQRRAPGLVIFTSGSTGTPRGVVHDVDVLVDRIRQGRKPSRALAFLMMDHVGGVNTLLRSLDCGGTLVIPRAHDPATVAAAVERHRVELLPVTPSFLNLLALSGAAEKHDLSTVKLVSYGTEPMLPSTLRRATALLPRARFHQLYGMSELGILPSQDRGDGDGWMILGGDGAEVRVVDGMLQVRAATAMLGYLDGTRPFTEDGWLITGDQVDTDGAWIRIRGRVSDLVNVGGRKVFPVEVEDVIAALPNITDVTVHGEPHALLGHVVVCAVRVATPEDPRQLRARIRTACHQQLASFKVPARVDVLDPAEPFDPRRKKARPRVPGTPVS